jgi:hypothetical protein
VAAKKKKKRSAPSRRRAPSRPAATPPGPPDRGRRWLAVRGAVLFGVAALGWVLFLRAPGPGTISAIALDTAVGAGCDDLERPVDPDASRAHLASGETFDYPDPPAAAGPHDPSPLPPDPHVRAAPVAETRAVHNLEHAYVLIWYRPAAEGGLSEATIAALETVAREEDRVIMAPYPSLPEDRSLALVAWSTRWLCPAGIAPEDATTVARAFIQAYRGTTNAPEAPRGLLGRLFVS